MANSTTSPRSSAHSPATPISSVRAIVSWLEKSGGSERNGEKDKNSEKGAKSTVGRGSEIHAVPAARRPHDVPRPVPVAMTPPSSIKTATRVTDKVVTKATYISASPPPSTPNPSSPFGRTLFPRNVSRTSVSTAAATISAHNVSPSPLTPTTPSSRRRYADDHRSAALLNGSSSLPVMPTTPTLITPTIAAAEYNDTPEDYSLTLLRYKAYFNRPLARYLDDEPDKQDKKGGPGTGRQTTEEETYGGQKRGRYDTNAVNMATVATTGDSVTRRHEKDIDAFWDPIRQYLLITDEELYES